MPDRTLHLCIPFSRTPTTNVLTINALTRVTLDQWSRVMGARSSTVPEVASVRGKSGNYSPTS